MVPLAGLVLLLYEPPGVAELLLRAVKTLHVFIRAVSYAEGIMRV